MLSPQTNAGYEPDGQNLYQELTFREPGKSVHLVYVVVQCYPWSNFYFPLFSCGGAVV